MLEKQDVLIVSVFGRGHWLAQELVARGLNVTMVDVSDKMGRWSPEDREGPFGYFRSERLSASQMERLVADEFSESVGRGFTIWSKKGPLEMKGPVIDHTLKSWGVSEECRDYLFRHHALSPSERESRKQKLLKQDFGENWLAHFAHHLASNEQKGNLEAMEHTSPLSIFSPFYLRRPSWRGFERGLDECRRKGVTVLADADVVDLSLSSKKLQGLEITSDQHSGLISADHVVWMLSSEESLRFDRRVHETLFPKGHLEPEWFWMRFRFSLEDHPCLREIPVFFVMIEDHYLDWSYDNCCIFIRTVKETDVDVWAKVSVAQRFHRSYVEGFCQRLCENFSRRLGGLEVQCVNWPQDYSYSYEQIGAPRFPLFSREKLQRFYRLKAGNLIFDGPEMWKGLDWASQFETQSEILEFLGSNRDQNISIEQSFLENRETEANPL